MPSVEMPAGIKRILAQCGAERIDDIQRVRESLVEIASMGTPLLPDFTLHNETHSDNIIRLLNQLRKEFGLRMGSYEVFLFAASAYLHDVGMFYDGAEFEEVILSDPAGALSFCPQGLCDSVENYQLFGLDTGGQVRETHSLLSAYWLDQEVTPIEGVTDDDRPYLMAICRGHGRTDLRERRCRCYTTVPHNGEEIRVALLASLLRLADAMDFHRNRTPAKVFRKNATALLRNPVALEHWIKHFFVEAPFVTKMNKGGNLISECTVYFSVPTKRINGVRYLDFFRPLFESHLEQAQRWAFRVSQYPPDLTTALGISDMGIVLDERELPGGRNLPPRIVREVEHSQTTDVPAFLDHCARIVESANSTGAGANSRAAAAESSGPVIPLAPVLIVEDHSWFLNHLHSILKEAGYQCELASTLEEGLRKLEKTNPAVLVLDIKLEGEFDNGWSLAQRAVVDEVPIVTVTGHPSVEGANRAIRDYDVICFLDKSRLSPHELIRGVSEAVRRGRKSRVSREQRQELFEKALGFFPGSLPSRGVCPPERPSR